MYNLTIVRVCADASGVVTEDVSGPLLMLHDLY